MIFKTFIIGMVLVGIAVILTELHRYMVYSEELKKETEGEKKLLQNLQRDLIRDLETIEKEAQGDE